MRGNYICKSLANAGKIQDKSKKILKPTRRITNHTHGSSLRCRFFMARPSSRCILRRSFLAAALPPLAIYRQRVSWYNCNLLKRKLVTHLRGVYHSKVLSGAKKERNQWIFLWSKVFLDKGIANRTIGRAYALIFRNQNPAYTIKKGRGNSYLLAELHSWRRPIGCCEWIWIRRGSMRTTVPSTRYSRAPVQSATLRLLTLWSAGSTPRLIVALPFARD